MNSEYAFNEWTCYEEATGRVCSIIGGKEEDVALNLEKGCKYIKGNWNSEMYYIDEGSPVLKNERPSITHIFDYKRKTWVYPELDKHKRIKWNEIKSIREHLMSEPFLFKNNYFQADTQIILAKVAVAQLDLDSFNQTWITADNNQVVLNGEDMLLLGKALDERQSSIFEKSQQLRYLIDNCSNNEEVESIHWNSI